MNLRGRTLALTVGASTAVVLLMAAPVTIAVFEAAEDEAEQDAITYVQGIADYVSTGTATDSDLAAVVERGNGRRDDTPVTVVLPDGSRLGTEQSSCTQDAARESDGDNRGGRDDGDDLLPVSAAQTEQVEGGTLVLVTAEGSDGTVVTCALVSDADLRSTVVGQLAPVAAASAAILVLVALASVLVARRLSSHLESTASTADRLTGGDLLARAPVGGPAEVRRVSVALNGLAGRIEELLRIERETAADLSHRLRTPLTTVRLDVEGLPPSDRKDELEEHVVQLERALTSVIHASRRGQREDVAWATDALAVARERFEYWQPLLEDQGRPASLVLAASVDRAHVRCARDELSAALDALLENAVAHTPEGTAVELEVGNGPGGAAHVEVRDQGPGVPRSAVQRGRSDRGSTGLGLDIARAAAESSGGRLELDRRDGWSIVRLVLGAA